MKIAVIGEGMLELSREPPAADQWRLSHGGDTLNTAIHLARLGFDVAFITALGADEFSAKLRRDWRAEGLDIGHVLTDADRLPGLYAIETDAQGERSFSYWRSDSAARRLFGLAGIEAAIDAAAKADLLYFSLISLAILPEEARIQLLGLCKRLRAQGGRVAFDSNYRPGLWPNAEAALSVASAAAGLSDIGLPTLADEQLLSGADTAEAVAAHWHALGTSEVVVKLGSDGSLISGGRGDHRHVPTLSDATPVDTSGAGDAFNAGYLGARLHGVPPDAAARIGHRIAAWVIGRVGAIPPPDQDAAYSQWLQDALGACAGVGEE